MRAAVGLCLAKSALRVAATAPRSRTCFLTSLQSFLLFPFKELAALPRAAMAE